MIRKLITERFSNLQTLFTQAVAQLYQVVETPYPVYFDQALNCARILARILPFMLEDTNSEEIRSLFWNKQIVPQQLTAGDETKAEGGEGGGAAATETVEETEPLAIILVNSLFHLLFLPGMVSLTVTLCHITCMHVSMFTLLPQILRSRTRTLSSPRATSTRRPSRAPSCGRPA